MRNYFDYNINGVDHNITLDELLQSSGVASSPYYGSNNKISWNTFINPFKPVISVVTKEQIESAIRKVIFVNAEYRIYGGDDPVVNVFGTINHEENKCIQASLSLETGKVLSVSNNVCWLN